jgi:hypothetical protein
MSLVSKTGETGRGKEDAMSTTTTAMGSFYDEKRAASDLRRYREKGPISSTRALIEALKAEGVEGATLLDIGGGIGAIQHELLDAGVTHATSVDASAPYLDAARGESERRGHDGRVTYLHGDFADLADSVPSADIRLLSGHRPVERSDGGRQVQRRQGRNPPTCLRVIPPPPRTLSRASDNHGYPTTLHNPFLLRDRPVHAARRVLPSVDGRRRWTGPGRVRVVALSSVPRYGWPRTRPVACSPVGTWRCKESMLESAFALWEAVISACLERIVLWRVSGLAPPMDLSVVREKAPPPVPR